MHMTPAIIRRLSATSVLLITLLACSSDRDVNHQAVTATEAAAHIEAVINWRNDRIRRLKAPGGYLNLVGLYWLSDGKSSFGSAPGNDVIFPGAISNIGAFEVMDGGVLMTVEDGVDVRVEGERVATVFLSDDLSDTPVTADLGSLTWTVINRDGRLAVRVRDLQGPAIEAFPPIPYFDIDREWRVTGTLRRFAEPKVINVGTVIEGLGYNPVSPGVVEFEYGGQQYSLEAYESGDELFFVFGDSTSGRETYAAGRFLYADVPGEDGQTVLDFNVAYNPPCAFNDFSTCPVANTRNRLKVAVTAGEKFDESLYAGSQH